MTEPEENSSNQVDHPPSTPAIIPAAPTRLEHEATSKWSKLVLVGWGGAQFLPIVALLELLGVRVSEGVILAASFSTLASSVVNSLNISRCAKAKPSDRRGATISAIALISPILAVGWMVGASGAVIVALTLLVGPARHVFKIR